MNAKLKRLKTITEDAFSFLVAPNQNRVRFTGYYPESNEYFQDYYFTPFFSFKQKPVVSSVAPSIEFFSVWNSIRKKAQSSSAKIKVFFTGECVHSDVFKEYAEFEDHLLNLVDVSFGFDKITAPNYIRYPLWVLYLFDKPEFSKDKIKHRIDEINQDFTRKALSLKTKDCAVIARHDKNGIRTSIWNAAQEAGLKIYSAGAWNHNDDSLWNEFANSKKDYLDQFKYTICPENCDYDGYVTEKLFQALLSGCVPLYWGSSNKPEPEVINQDVILFYDKSKPEKLIERLKELQSNEKLFEKLVCQKPLKDYAVDYIYELNQKTKKLCTEIAASKGLI